MNNEFDKDLKQRLGEASLQEAGLPFDKDKLWGKIEKKKAKKRIVFLPWISHAAAVAAGLAVGLFLLKGKDQPLVVPDVVIHMNDTTRIQTIRDTVYLVKNATERNQQPSPALRKATSQQPAPATVIHQQENIVTETNLPGKDVEPILVSNKPSQPKVLHLSDMDNENSKPRPVGKSNFAFLKKYLKDDLQGENPETFSMIVGKTIFNTKN